MAAFELVIKDAKLNKETICEKLKKPQQPRSPLADRLDNAQRRRDEKLNEKKEKAAVDLANKQKKVREQEEELKVKEAAKTLTVEEHKAKVAQKEAEELAEKNKKIEEKVKAAEEKRAKILEAERQRLREKHEKAKLVPLNKKKVDPSPEE